ncbi:MAG: (d)CMP kinase [Desulfonauticus sp.]|nr:(d)CMP kinase [Desulfonauticus sp.]
MTDDRLLITIDGPAGVGKTTLAKKLASYLNIAYLDTGAMFRGLAYCLGKTSLNWTENELEQRLAGLSFDLIVRDGNFVLTLNQKVLGDEIRSEEIGFLASTLGTKPVIRNFLKQEQRKIGAKYPLVAEGRDMGSCVFPDARYKFFLDADVSVRAKRRVLQLEEKGMQVDFKSILDALRKRDFQDRNRKIAPLKPAKDAVIIDTTHLSAEEVFDILKNKITRGS